MRHDATSRGQEASGRQNHSAGQDATRTKLIEAAGQIFAERGYYAATVREICMRAGANVAAVNYHFGDKLGLYTEVLKQSVHAANIEGIRTALGQNAAPEKILRDVIRARLRGVTRGEFPDWQFQIMTHEFAQPTPALAHVLNEVARPIYGRLLDVIGRIVHLPPNHEITRLCAHSVLGQVLHYVLASPLLLRMWPELEMTPQQVDKIADHIADFSLAYLREIASKRKIVSMAKGARRSK